jgi:hypothetical protein
MSSMSSIEELIEKAKVYARQRADLLVSECEALCAEYGQEPTQELLSALLAKPSREAREEFLNHLNY